MPPTAEAELTIQGPVDTVFAQFIDYRQWASWMPKGFRPMRGPARPLRKGDRVLVSVTGLPSLLTVDVVQPSTEVSWSGGLPGLLMARHSFYFEDAGAGATRIRSVEPWTGLLTKIDPVIKRIVRVAGQVGYAQLEGFERWFAREHGGHAPH